MEMEVFLDGDFRVKRTILECDFCKASVQKKSAYVYGWKDLPTKGGEIVNVCQDCSEVLESLRSMAPHPHGVNLGSVGPPDRHAGGGAADP